MRLSLTPLIRRSRQATYASWLAVLAFAGAGTSALAAPVEVNNHSFERAALDPGGWNNDLPDPNNPISGSDWIGQAGPGDGASFVEYIDGFSAEGNQHLGMQDNYYVFQNTGAPWQANSIYTLTVAVGNRNADFSPAGALAIIGLTNLEEAPSPDNRLAGETANAQLTDDPVLAGASTTFDSGTLAEFSYQDVTVEFSTGDTPPAGNIVIFLGDDVSDGRAHFDNVRLWCQPAGTSIGPAAEFQTASRAANPIVLDGNLSEWSAHPIVGPQFRLGADAVGLASFEPFDGGTWDGPEDQSSTTWISWDDNNLYLGVAVTDDYHENAANSGWNGDALQLHVANAARDTQVTLVNYALGGVEGSLGDIIINEEAGPGGSSAVISRDGTQTIYEICLPKETLGLDALALGTQLGIGFTINDGDEAEPGQKGWGGLGAHSVVFGKTPSETALVTLGGPAGELRLDFGSTGPNANGSAPGWIPVSNLAQDVPFSLGDGVTITALEDGFNPNNTAGPGADTDIGERIIPQSVVDDYLFKITDTAGTSAQMRIDGLPAGDYNITVFEGRTTDAGQMGKIWVGDEPADPNTGDFAAGKSGTVSVSVADGDSVFYRHLEDGSGGISGMIIQPVLSALDILYLGANDAPDAGADAEVVAFLESRFGPVRYMNSSNTDGTETADVIVMSSTFGSGTVRGKFHNSPVPILNWEEALMDASAAGEFGQSPGGVPKSTETTQLALSDHPIAGDMAGTTIDFLTEAGAEMLASDGLSAGTEAVATAVGGPIDGKPSLFVTEAGAEVAEGAGVDGNVSPARRVAFPMTDVTFNTVTDAGKELLARAILWAAGRLAADGGGMGTLPDGAHPLDTPATGAGLAGWYWNLGPKDVPTAMEPMHRAGDGPEGADNSNSGWVDENVYNALALTGQFTATTFEYLGNDLTPIEDWLGADSASYSGADGNLDDGVFRFTGYVRIDAPGEVTFTTNTDDGSVVYVNDQLVVSNDNGHGDATVSGTFNFPAAGYYPVDIRYFNGDWTNDAGDHGGANFRAEAGVSGLVQGLEGVDPLFIPVGGGTPVEFTKLWLLGDDTNGNQTEFSQEQGMDTAPGSATAQDDDFYFAGVYPDPIGTVAEDEPFTNFDRAHVPGDPFNRIHFNLDAASAAADTQLRMTFAFCCFGAVDAGPSEHDLVIRLNGQEFFSDTGIDSDRVIEETVTAGDFDVVEGANTIEIERTGGSDSAWIQYDYVRLEASAVGDGGGPGPGLEQYASSFDFADGTTDLGDGSTISSNDGTASIQGGVLRLTEAGINGTTAAFVLPPGFDGSQGWTATFDLAIEHSGENTPADGMSFNYGAIPGPDNYGNPAEEGYGDATPHISYQVDTWLWDNPEDQDPGVGIEVTGVEVAFTQAANDAANVMPNDRAEARVTAAWDPEKGASFITNGFRTEANFINVPTPGFTADPSHGFSILARTGGHNETVEIDNLVIVKGVHLPDTGPEPIPEGALKVHYDFETGGGTTVVNLASGGGATVVADSIADWVPGEQGTNGWTYGYRDLAVDAPIDYDPVADFIEFPDTWNTGTSWDEPNEDEDNIPWTTLAQESGHPNGPNSGELHHWAIRRWVSDITGPANISYTAQKENNGCGNGVTVGVHLNGVRLEADVIENNMAPVTTTVGVDLAEGDIIDLILSPVGADETDNDGCDGTLFSMEVAALGDAQNGTLITTNDAAWQSSLNTLSPGGPGYMFFDSANGADATYVDTGFNPASLNIMNAPYTMMARVRQDALGDGDNMDAMVFGQIEGDVLHNGARGEQLHQGHWGNDITGGSVDLGNWRHITWVYDGNETGTLSIYVNGEQVVTGDFGGLFKSDSNILIGTTRLDQNRDFIGCLDDVRIYCAALSQAQIRDIAFSLGGATGGTFLARHIGAAEGSMFESMEQFQAALDDPDLRSFDVLGAEKAINFMDNGNDGFVGGGVPFPAFRGQSGDHNDFGVHVTGQFYVPEAGPRTFDGVSDDGNLYFIDGVLVGGDPGLHGNNDAFGTIDLSPGLHHIEAFYFERGGGASFEILMADEVGEFTDRGAATFRPLQAAFIDKDGDGMDDNFEIGNFGDTSRDGTGDFDGDRLNDATEFLLGTDPLRRDTDGDQLWDGAEVIAHFTDPLNADSDGDGLNDWVEVADIGSDPNDEDTDNDGLRDGDEVAGGPSTTLFDFESDPGLEIINFSDEGIAPEIRAEGGNPGGYLSLTDAVNGARATVIFPDTDGSNIAGFRFGVDARIGGGTPDPADGMSISLVRPSDPLLEDPRGSGFAGTTDLGAEEENLPEEGSQTGVSVGFDAWESGGDDIIGFSVRVDGELITQVPAPTKNGSLTDPTSLQTGPRLGDDPEANLEALGWARFEIVLGVDGVLDVIWKGTKIVEGVQTNWVPGPGQLVFAARTGGANQAHHFDNLALTVIPEGALDPVVFNPGATVPLVHYDFEGAGGAAYAQDFDALEDGTTDLGDGSLLFSVTDSAQVVDGALQLTVDGVGGQSAYWKTPPLSGLSGGFTADFDVSLFRGEGGNPPADGFSFNLGMIADDAQAGEEGFGSGLAVEFDTWNNGGEGADNGIGIDISVDGADVAINRAAADADPRDNEFFQFDGEFRHVHVNWRPADGGGPLDIIFVSFHDSDDPSQAAADAGLTEAPDKGYTDLLTANGHNVTRWATRDDPTGDDLAVLNGADLIVISRSVNSGHFQQEAEFWNTMVTTPVMNLGGYTWRDSRLNWTDGGTMVDSDAPITLEAVDADHPILAGADLSQPYANFIDGERGVSFNMNTIVGGSVIATAADDGSPVATGPAIVEFAAGAEVNNGNILAGPRVGFLTGSREADGVTSQTAGLYDLTATGEILFLNAVDHITGNGGGATEGGLLDVTYGDLVIAEDLPVNWGPQDGDRVAFGARTGGATETLLLDNFIIAGVGGASGNTVANLGSLGDGTLVAPEGTSLEDLVVGGVLNLSGNETYIDTNHSSDALRVNGNANYTMMARIRPSRVAGDNMVFGQLGTDLLLHNGIRDGSWHFGHWGNDITTGTAEVDTWYNVAWRYSAGVQTIFVNGESVGSAARGGLNNSENILVGLTRIGEDRAFQGMMDDVRIFDGGLSQEAIANLQGDGEPAAPELLVHYEFEDGITTTIRNNGRKGAPDGHLNSLNVIGAYPSGMRSPSLGGDGMLFFDSAGGADATYVDTGLTAAEAKINGSVNYTMMAWARPTSDRGGDQMIFGQGDGNALHNGIRDQRMHIGHWGNDLNAGEARVAFGQWQHMAFTYDTAGNQTIYINGVQVAQENHGGLNNPDHNLLIGMTRFADDRDYEGFLDDVRVYCGTLSGDQIAQVAGLGDSDGDGLPDWFERAHFGNLAMSGDDDADGDGISNSDERRLGLDPNASDAQFADADGDGWTKGDEDDFGTDDNNATSFPQIFTGGGQWEVRVVQADGVEIATLAAADALLNGETAALADETTFHEFINFGDGANGLFDMDTQFSIEADGDKEDFVMHAKGVIEVPHPGNYNLNLRTDDGGRVIIDGENVWNDDSLHGDRDGIFAVTLSPGQHTVEVTMFERGGGDNAELTGAILTENSLNGLGGGSFQLIPAAVPDERDIPAGLLAYWNFNDGSGDPRDLVNGVPAVLAGGAEHGEGPGGAGDGAIDFGMDNGGQTLVVTPTILAPISDTDQLTVSFFQNLHSVINSSAFWADAAAAGDRAFQAHAPWGNGNIFFDTAGCCDPPQRISGPVDTPPGVWQHFAFVKNGPNKAVYVDGVEVLSGTDAAPIPEGFLNFNIGSANGGGSSMAGLIDEFSIWSRALNPDEIVALAAGEPAFAPPAIDPLVDMGPITSASDVDFSGNIVYAVNARGPGGMTIGDAVFTHDADTPGLNFVAQNEIAEWAPLTEFGDSADDNALETILNSIRWSNAADDPTGLTYDFSVSPGDYKVTLLFAEKCCDRGFDVSINGSLVADDFSPRPFQTAAGGDAAAGAFLSYEFTQQPGVLSINLDGTNADFPDKNAIIMGIVVERLEGDANGGLLAYWRFNEADGEVAIDSSGNGHDGTIIMPDGARVSDPDFGSVYQSGGGSFVDLGSPLPVLGLETDFTWSFWVNSEETDNNNIVLGNRYQPDGTDFDPREFIKFTPRTFEWHFNAAGENIPIDDNTMFEVGVWAHNVVVKDGSTLTYYRDGVEIASSEITGAPVNAQPLYLGGQWGADDLVTENFAGQFDEVAIFNRALSPTEVVDVYNRGLDGTALNEDVNGGGDGANIVFVSFHDSDDPSQAAADAGLTEAPDKGYTDLLTANGHNVTRWATRNDPTGDDLAVLNAADLIIISRSANSGHYNEEAAFWNEMVTTPVMNLNGYTWRDSRLNWTDGGTMVDSDAAITLVAANGDHPILAGADLSEPYANFIAGERGVSFNMNMIVGGTVVATAADDGSPVATGPAIVEFATGAEVNNGNVLAGPRVGLLTGSRELDRTSETAGMYDLTATGEVLFLNAVDYLLGGGPAPQVKSTKALVDSDHDGMADVIELIAGTNAGDPTDYFYIRKIALGDGGITIEFDAKADRAYEIEYSETMMPDSWRVIGSQNAGESSLVEFHHAGEEQNPHGFYRARVVQD